MFTGLFPSLCGKAAPFRADFQYYFLIRAASKAMPSAARMSLMSRLGNGKAKPFRKASGRAAIYCDSTKSLNHPIFILHFHQAQALCGRGGACLSAVARGKYAGNIFRSKPALAHLNQRAYDVSHHVAQEALSRHL